MIKQNISSCTRLPPRRLKVYRPIIAWADLQRQDARGCRKLSISRRRIICRWTSFPLTDSGVKGIGFDEGGVQKLYLDTNPEAIIAGVRKARERIKSTSQPNLPLHYTEWSTSYSPRDPVHDSYISAPYILSKLKGSEGYADSMSYWTFTDIFEENGPVPSPFHGGFGLLNFQGLRKPSFYAYQFLNKLGDTELVSNDAEQFGFAATSAAFRHCSGISPRQKPQRAIRFSSKKICPQMISRWRESQSPKCRPAPMN